MVSVNFSSHLEKAYDEVVGRIDGRHRQLAFRIVSWLFRAQRILRMNELLEALVVEEGDTDLWRDCLPEPTDVVNCCKSLVLHEETSGLVRFSHETVKEYIKKRSSLLPPVTDLAKGCLTYLRFNEFHEFCEGRVPLESWVQEYQFSLYCAQFWGFHARQGEESQEIQEAVFECFITRDRRNAILQLAASNGRISSVTDGHTLLHILAETGLVRTCALAIKRGPEVQDQRHAPL
jgi:hypothetical protein